MTSSPRHSPSFRPGRHWRHLCGLWLLALICSAAVAAGPEPLKVGTAVDYRPLVYSQDGKVVGMEADFARLLEAQLGRKLVFKIMPRADLLPALAHGDVDLVMAGLRVTPERQQQVLFADPYLKTGLMAIIRTADVMRFHNPASLLRGGYRAAAVTGGGAADYMRSHFGPVTVVPVASADAGLQALLDKRADVFLGDASSSWSLATEPRYGDLMSLGRLLTEVPLAWAVAKGNTALRDQLNTALRELRQTGVLEHVYDRWIPVNAVTGD